ncbi:tRNA-uridine aminocarboxypropyltransferase A-like [Castanea sativa]|uniref:tRNA-uridine aminocarboxypropyltransferase A-like n=1 Tax=Castanea sativa TaxID=21020 RepID=UPI003F64F301
MTSGAETENPPIQTTAESESESEPEPPQPRRPICSKCSRPTRVCLCETLPAQPIPTKTHILIIQHPHEARHKLSTVPLLTKCLLNSTTVVTRRLRHGLSPLLDQSPPAVYLFPPTPSSPAVTLSQSQPQNDNDNDDDSVVLIVFDATWKHAREMVRASEEYLSRFASRVCLEGYDESVGGRSIYDSDSELILRKEPCGGCVSTMEAVARALRVIEPNGLCVEAQLLRVLRDMVRLQARYLTTKPIKPRPKLEKKKKKAMQIEEKREELLDFKS